jgi:CHAT domain-containing protein
VEGELPPLASANREIDAVEAWAQRRQIATERYQDDQSHREQVIAALQHTRLAHIACHGMFAPDNPGGSGLLLFPTDERSDLLSLRDLSELDLAGLEHISLAACWSADNFILPGRQIMSLPETLWRSRAGSILGSLWPVHDELSSAFMQQFYAYLEQHPRDEALRRTQVDCLSNQLPGFTEVGRSTAHPSFWAGFTLYGRPGRMFTGSPRMPDG